MLQILVFMTHLSLVMMVTPLKINLENDRFQPF